MVRGSPARLSCLDCPPGVEVPAGCPSYAHALDETSAGELLCRIDPRASFGGITSSSRRPTTPALRANATAVRAEWTLSLCRMLWMWVRTVFGETCKSTPISLRD